MHQKQKIMIFWNLVRGGCFAVLAGSVYALYQTAECWRSPSFESTVVRQAIPFLVETLAVSALIMATGCVLGTYLLRRSNTK